MRLRFEGIEQMLHQDGETPGLEASAGRACTTTNHHQEQRDHPEERPPRNIIGRRIPCSRNQGSHHKKGVAESGLYAVDHPVCINPNGRDERRDEHDGIKPTHLFVFIEFAEFAIQEDHLFEQVMVVGEGRPYITALVVVNDMLFKLLCEEVGITPDSPALNLCRDLRAKVVKRVRMAARHFPQYCVPRNVYILREHWTAEDGLLTPTMKLRRRQIAERFAKEIEELYDSPRKR